MRNQISILSENKSSCKSIQICLRTLYNWSKNEKKHSHSRKSLIDGSDKFCYLLWSIVIETHCTGTGTWNSKLLGNILSLTDRTQLHTLASWSLDTLDTRPVVSLPLLTTHSHSTSLVSVVVTLSYRLPEDWLDEVHFWFY